MAHLVDSSVWVALFLDFDTQHEKARRVIEKLEGTIYVPYCVIAEVVTVLAYKHSKQLADNFILYVRDNRDIKIINDDALYEMDFYMSMAEKLSFTDVALIFLSRKVDAELVTFDKQIARTARNGGKR